MTSYRKVLPADRLARLLSELVAGAGLVLALLLVVTILAVPA